MIGYCRWLNLSDIPSWINAMIFFIEISKMLFPFGSKNTLAAQLLQGDMEAPQAGKKVDKAERGRFHLWKI